MLQVFIIQSLAWARWVQDGSALNVNTGNNALYPSVDNLAGTPYVAWSETNGTAYQIYVKHWNGAAWVQDSTSLNVNTNQTATTPSLKLYNGVPYIAWAEINGSTGHIYEKHWNGSGWQSDGNSLNVNSNQAVSNPSLAIYNGIPYVGWSESNGTAMQIYIKHWNGANWIADGSSLNIDASKNASVPWLALDEGTPYMAWEEYNSANGYDLVHVKYRNYWSVWVKNGDYVSNIPAYSDESPSLAIYNHLPYIVSRRIFHGISGGTLPPPSIYMMYWDGSAWQADGGSLNINSSPSSFIGALNPCLTISNGTPYVVWAEAVGVGGKSTVYYNRIFEKHWNGTNWSQDGTASLNINSLQNANNPSLAVYNGTPYVAWSESNGSVNQIYMKHWVAETISSVEPEYKITGNTVQVSIYSANFNGASSAKLVRAGDSSVSSTGVTQNNQYNYCYSFNLAGAVPDVYDVEVTTPDYQGSIKQAFGILSPLKAPVAWTVFDLGAAGGLTVTANYCNLVIGDPDQDNSQELYISGQDQSLHQFKKVNYGWNISSMPAMAGTNFQRVLLADGEGCGEWALYGAAADNHVYQYKRATWEKSDLGSTTYKIFGLAKMDADNDGVPEIYTACENGHIYQYKFGGVNWTLSEISSAFPTSQANFLTAGDGNNDHTLELYSANADYQIYQYKVNGTSWEKSLVGNGGLAMNSVAVGDGDNDGENEVYAACQDGKIYQFRWSGSAWSGQSIGTGGAGPMFSVAVSDADNDGANEVYAACGDGHVYEFKKTTSWNTLDLGNAKASLYTLAVGDADNDHHFEVYALGQNNHVYQFKAASLATPTATPTPTAISTPVLTATPLLPQKFFKVFHSQINQNHSEQARICWTQEQADQVTITIYNLLGDKIIALIDNQIYPAGQYNEVIWNGKSKSGAMVGSGIYLVVLQTGGRKELGKVAIIK